MLPATARTDQASFLPRARVSRSSRRHDWPYAPIIPIRSAERLKSRWFWMDKFGLRTPKQACGSLVGFSWRRRERIDVQQPAAKSVAYAGENFCTGSTQSFLGRFGECLNVLLGLLAELRDRG